MPFSPFEALEMPNISVLRIYSPLPSLLQLLDKALCDTGQLPSLPTAPAGHSYLPHVSEQLSVKYSVMV